MKLESILRPRYGQFSRFFVNQYLVACFFLAWLRYGAHVLGMSLALTWDKKQFFFFSLCVPFFFFSPNYPAVIKSVSVNACHSLLKSHGYFLVSRGRHCYLERKTTQSMHDLASQGFWWLRFAGIFFLILLILWFAVVFFGYYSSFFWCE